jgi:hypothetical protein
MGVMRFLGRIDSRVVPRLARGLHRVSAATQRYRLRLRPLTVVATVLLLAVAATGVWRLVRPEPNTSTGTSPVRVGVRDGDSVPRYLEASRAKLSALAAARPDDPVYALVTFGRYLNPDQVRAVATAAPGITPLRGYARVPIPGRQTERVVLAAARLPGDLIADMAAVAARKDGDAATYERMATDEAGVQLRAIYDSNARVSRAEAEGYRTGCACVFALLVRATPGALTALAEQPDVRAVDPADNVSAPDDAVFEAPLPEQTDRVEPPADNLPS